MPRKKDDSEGCAKSFLAIITPVGKPSGVPPGEGLPDHIWGGGNEPFPTPPIVIVPGDPPVFIWGGGNEPFPTPPIVIMPGDPPLAIWGPPDMPPGFWGGGMGPGVKPQPHPEHPIAPGGEPKPPVSGAPPHPAHPIVNVPAHPIVIPPPPDPFPEPPPEVIKPAPDTGGWGYANPPGAWYYVPPQDVAQPKK